MPLKDLLEKRHVPNRDGGNHVGREGATGGAQPPATDPLGQSRRTVAGVDATVGLDTVREILFGDRARQLEQPLAQLEERANLMDSLVAEKFDDLYRQLDQERSARSEANTRILEQIERTTRALEKGLTELEEKIDSADGKLHNHFAGEIHALTETIRKRHDEMADLVDRRVTELKERSTERTTLADLLSDLAERLREPSPDTGTAPPREN
jgi:septal ring factor EnvC (AmiA/AmiB activator)